MYSIDFKSFMSDNNFGQKEAAEYFGCKQSFISQISTGRSKIPESFISKILADELIIKKSLSYINDNQDKNNTNTLIEIINKQIDVILKKDEQINRLITILENNINK